MGENPTGLLIYSPDGHISVNMMRTSGTADEPVTHEYLGYAGNRRVSENRTIHTIHVTPVCAWVGSE
ncbi:hypothetical protein GCM10023324_34250 [Streptomyces youssoufiensis]